MNRVEEIIELRNDVKLKQEKRQKIGEDIYVLTSEYNSIMNRFHQSESENEKKAYSKIASKLSFEIAGLSNSAKENILNCNHEILICTDKNDEEASFTCLICGEKLIGRDFNEMNDKYNVIDISSAKDKSEALKNIFYYLYETSNLYINEFITLCNEKAKTKVKVR